MRRILFLQLLLSPLFLEAQITSTFDTDADGWMFLNNGTPITVNHNATNGNPGGYVSANYSSNATATSQGWFAPAKFLGLKVARSYGMNLHFDLQQAFAGTASSGQGDVRIVGNAGFDIVFSLPVKPAVAPAWSSYTIKLDETGGWRVGSTGGALATKNDVLRALTNIVELEIRGTYITNANNVVGLDNVILEQNTIGIAPVVTSTSATSGKPGDVITITGSGFNTIPTNNVVSFGIGGVKAAVQSASATQLTIVVSQNASYGPIVITNTVTGLSARTTPFNPVFDGGGRIIPASFKPKFDIPTIEIESIAAADVDGDGWIDLVVTNDFSDRVIDIYRNLGTGGTLSDASFAAKVSVAYTGVSSNGTGLWFADLDGDGKLDAVTSTSSGGIGRYVTFRNTSTPGSISFEAPEYWQGATDESPISFIADLDGDGRPEMMSGEGAIPGSFWFNQNISTPGNIEFGSWVAPFSLAVINGFTEANAADLNGDGKPELIVTNGQGQAIDILQNTSTPGSPSFTAAFQFTTNQYTTTPVLVADMNLDGKNDLLYKTSGEVGFHIRLNADTDGILTAADFAADLIFVGDLSGGISNLTGISMADMNGDGKPDIVANDNTDFGVFENVFAGGVFDINSLVPAYQYEAPGLNTGPTAPIAVDLNGDGKPEILSGITNAGTPDKFTIYENVNIRAPLISLNTVSPLSGQIGSTVTITGSNFSTVTTENIVRFGSVKATVLTATANQLTVTVPPGAAYAPVSVTKAELTSTYHLPFQTTFSSGATFNNTHFAPPVQFTLTNADYDIVVSDLDNDGLPDVAAESATLSTSVTSLFRNTHTSGAINATSLTLNGTTANAHSQRLEDLDGDGLIDMMGARGTVHKNNSTTGNISFQAGVAISNVDGVLAAFSDFNKDGKTDIVVTRGGLQVIMVENRTTNLTGNFTTGTFSSFAPGVFIPRPGSSGTLVTGDFDNDGYADMIATNPTLDNISIFRNAQQPRANVTSFAATVELATGDNPQFIYTGDFDRDSKLDVLVLHGAGTTTALLILFQNTSTIGTISFNRIDLTNPSATTTATVADVDGDGKPEILTTSETGNRFSIFKNLHTTGALTAASFAAPFNTTVTAPRGIATGDLNLDGKPEIILTRAAGLLVVYENRVSSILPPTITSFTSSSGAAGSSVTITGTNFDITPGNNIVSFGVFAGTKGIIQSASTTQLTVQVPDGAVYGPLTVTNKVTGLSAKSSTPFNPVFEGGGRIIPASFKDRFSIATIPIEGWFVDDIDGDGWEDFAVANNNTEDQIDIYRNLGLGGELSAASFATKVTLPMPPLGGSGANGTGLWFADLDGDGKTDAVSSTHSGSGSTFVTFRNTSTPGNITFEAAEYWAGGSDETPIALVTDFDGDGRPDLLAGEGSLSSVAFSYFWINQNLSIPGDIGFGSPIFPFNGSVVNAFAVATAGDLDGDGKNELVITHNFGQQTTVLKNTSTLGIPSFSNAFTISTNQYNLSVHVADMNLDGKNDLVYKISGEAGIHIRLNANSGGALVAGDFASDIIISGDLGTGGGISLADVNGDGKTDIVASDNTDVGVYENIFAGGVFDATAFVPAYQILGGGSSTPRISDLNHDGKPDFVIASGGAISIVENKNVSAPVISINTVSPLSAPIGSIVAITGNNFSTIVAENDVWFGDVRATVLTASTTQLTVTVPAGAGYAPVSVRKGELSSSYHLPFSTSFSSGVTFDNTHFAPPVTYPLSGAEYDIEVGDLDLDGKPDVIADGTGQISRLFQNAHTSGAISSTSLSSVGTVANSTNNAKLVDVDGDSKLDIVGGSGRIFPNQSTVGSILFGTEINSVNGDNVTFGDLNQDGKTDLAAAAFSSGSAQLLLQENRSNVGTFVNSGTYGTFTSNIIYTKASRGGDVTIADFDNDGHNDVVSLNPFTDNMSIFRNAQKYRVSSTTFDPRVEIAVGDNPLRSYPADFDKDGKMDLLVTHWTGTSTTLLIVLQNTSTVGNISFNRIDLTNPSTVTIATVSDLDGDGKPEIITTSETGNRFSIFENLHTTGALTAASFAAPFNTTVTAPRGITTGDLNLDGKPEIILTRAAGLLVVYENLVPTISISITQQPASPYYACEGGSASFTTAASGTTNITYQWQKFDGSAFVDLANDATYGGVTAATLTISNVSSSESGDYQCVISGDFAADVLTATANLVFNSLPSPPLVTSGVSCGPGIVTLTASGGGPGDYRWYSGSPLTIIAGEQNETFVTPSLTTNTQYHVSLTDTFCESVPVAVTAIISTIPAQPIITSSITPVGNALTICTGTSLMLSAPNGFASYLWSDGSTAPQLSVSASGTYSVSVIDGNGCASPASDGVVITVQANPCSNSAPVITTTTASTTLGNSVSIDLSTLISDPDNNLVLSSLTVSQPTSGAVASITGTSLLIDYAGLSFTGIEIISIQVCDVFGECATQTFQISVIGEIEIFNAVSANGDNKNPYFRIENIAALEPNNMVTIYNRWGSQVFEVENYSESNAFRGLNQNGNELPSGTYFYKIFFKDSGKSQNGYLVLRK